MAEKKRDEKDEKGEEKRGEKEEKWRRDRVNAVVWASIAVWAALIILAEVTDFGDDLGNWWEAWAVFFAGAGTLILLGTFYRLLVPAQRRSLAGGMILGFVFLGIGLGDLIGWGYIWVVVLIAVALVILFSAFGRQREPS